MKPYYQDDAVALHLVELDAAVAASKPSQEKGAAPK